MPWCPNCKIEYREDFSQCSDCNADLVNEDPNLTQEPEDTVEDFVTLVLLADIYDPYELDIILPILKEEGIAFSEKEKTPDGYLKYYMGGRINIYGTHIFVSKGDYPRAKELLDAYIDKNRFAEDSVIVNEDHMRLTEKEIEEFDKSIEKRNKVSRFGLILLIFIMPFAALALSILLAYFRS